MQTRMVTLANLDKFSHIGLFSGGTISMDDVNNTPGFKEKVKLVFVSYGSREIGGNRGGRAGAAAPAARTALPAAASRGGTRSHGRRARWAGRWPGAWAASAAIPRPASMR